MPIQIGDAERTVGALAGAARSRPVREHRAAAGCRPDACLLRTSYSSAHTSEDIDRALAIYERVGRELAIIEAAA